MAQRVEPAGTGLAGRAGISGTPVERAARVTEEVADVLDGYARAWSVGDLQQVADQWDGDAEVTYVAEELHDVLTDRAQVAEHLLRTEHRLTRSGVELGGLRVRELADGLALATFVCRWDFDWTSYSRVSAILRRREDRWRFVHYMEAPYHVEEASDAGRG